MGFLYKSLIMIFDLYIFAVILLHFKRLLLHDFFIFSFKALIFIITRFTSYFIVTVVILTLLWRTPMGKLSWMIVNWGLKIVLFISFHVLIGVIAYKTEIAYFETLLYTVGISLIVYFRVANLCSRMCIPYQPILLQIFSMALTLSVYLSWMQKGLNR